MLMIMLAGNAEQILHHLAHRFGRGQTAIHKITAGAFKGDDPFDHQLGVWLTTHFRQFFQDDPLLGTQFKKGLNRCRFCPASDPGCRGLAAAQQMNGLQDDGFPCSGLAGKNRKPLGERNM